MEMKKTEDGEQMTVVEWADIQAKSDPRLRNLYHVPNEGRRSWAEAGRQRRMGLRSGVPDLILDYPSGIYHGLRIEMKIKPNRLTKEQLGWMARLERAGYATAVAWSAREAIETIREYLNLTPGEAFSEE